MAKCRMQELQFFDKGKMCHDKPLYESNIVVLQRWTGPLIILSRCKRTCLFGPHHQTASSLLLLLLLLFTTAIRNNCHYHGLSATLYAAATTNKIFFHYCGYYNIRTESSMSCQNPSTELLLFPMHPFSSSVCSRYDLGNNNITIKLN